MKQIQSNASLRRAQVTLIIFALALAFWTTTALATTTIDMANGVAAGIGIAWDPVNANIYYVEYGAGTLKRIHINAGCDLTSPATCPTTTVASGFTHPEDVALDVDHGLAYVTTRDDLGTTGVLWRVDLASGTKTMVTFNLGAPQQIALDTPTNTAYVIAYDIGKLWKIDLTTGAKAAVMTGLGRPVGLAITADRTRAYVTEQMPAQLAEIDLATHVRIRNVVTGLTSPFFLSWTDPAQYALYLVERDPANDVLRVDLPSSTATPVITGLPNRPSGIAVNLMAGAVYVATDSKVVKVVLAELPMGEPVFLGVGNVPSTKIKDGYATTDSGYFFQVTDSPFGGTLNILGNLSHFKALGATHYRVLVSYQGVKTTLGLSWNTYHWNAATNQNDLKAVAPVPGLLLPTPGPAYAIPDDYAAPQNSNNHPERWFPPFLMMQWPSGNNGLYTFSVEIWENTGTPNSPVWNDRTYLLPSGKNSLTVLVDNSGFNTDVVAIRQHGTTTTIPVCTIVSSGTSKFDVEVTAYDPNQHLLSYSLVALFGHNGYSLVVPTDTYASHVDAEGKHLWSGEPPNTWMPASGWQATCDCAHTFYLDAWKRTIDGYHYLLEGTAHQSITINNTGTTCPL